MRFWLRMEGKGAGRRLPTDRSAELPGETALHCTSLQTVKIIRIRFKHQLIRKINAEILMIEQKVE